MQPPIPETEHVGLRGGGRLAYVEVGDPGGEPALHCHGWPGSRLDALALNEEARRAGVRILAPDRPGLGRSTPRPRRRIADWPDDAARLADHLGLDRFAVLGVSGGAPYAAATAARLPERVTRLALVAPLGPLDDSRAREGMPLRNRLMLGLCRHAPPVARAALRAMRASPGPDARAFARRFVSAMAEPDRRLFEEDPAARRVFVAALDEAFRQGVGPVVAEGGLYDAPWGFDPGAVNAPTDAWHGLRDRTVPPSATRWYARRVPDAEAHFLQEEAHLSLVAHHGREILERLAA